MFPLAGFWSKDEILGNALRSATENHWEGIVALVLLIIAAGFTAFYMWRQICLVFLGAPRTEAAANAPESSRLMTYPLLILMFLSVFGGLLNLPEALSGLRLPTEALPHCLEHTLTYPPALAFTLPFPLAP